MDNTKAILNAIEALSKDVKTLGSMISSLDNRTLSLEDKVSTLDDKVSTLDDKVSTLDDKVKSIQLTLENETNRNISIIAEGHLTLERKLDESLKVNQEKELLYIRLNQLENEVRILKERISGIA